jgi:hypothetical protein
MSRLYGPVHRSLQDRFDTRRLADNVETRVVLTEIPQEHKAFIESRDMFFLSTIDQNTDDGSFRTIANFAIPSISAFAEDAPARVRGTLQKMHGNNLTIATKSGKEANVPLKDGAPMIAVTKGAMSDIKSNTFVGITAMPQSESRLKFTFSRSPCAGPVKDTIRGT